MQLVERHIIVGDKALEDICFKAARLYNYCNYYRRQVHFGTLQKFTEYELTGMLAEFKQEDYRALPAQTSQQIIKLLFKNWKAYFAALKQYKKTPALFSGKPKPPKYKDKTGFGICIFTKQQIKLKDGYINFPKSVNLEPLKTKIDKIAQVRIVPKATCFVIEVVYNVKPQQYDVKKELFLSIDLGVNNFATCISNVGDKPFIINGRVLKSVNQYYNKRKAEAQSFIGDKGTSRRIATLIHNRNNYIEDKLHKISRFIVNYCIDHEIGTIIIGKNPLWKDECRMSAKNNQHFVQLPHAKLIDKITYKAFLCGIAVEVPEESYSSKCDHLALELMQHHDQYLGKRVKRGLFQSSTGVILNADVNGAIGIARKVVGDSAVTQIADKGLAFNPVKLTI